MKNCPEYFSMNDDEKDEFKQSNSHLEDLFFSFIFEYLSKKNVISSSDPNNLTYADFFEINKELGILRGIGENNFYMNENFSLLNSLLSLKTLYDYDYANNSFQENLSNIDNKVKNNNDPKEYKMRLTGYSCQAFISGEFKYISLYSPALHIYNEIEKDIYQLSYELMPYNIKINSAQNNKKANFKYEGKGKEFLISKLQEEIYNQMSSLYYELINFFHDNKMNCIWEIKRENEENHIDYVFSDKDVIKNIRFKHFENDLLKFKTCDTSFLDMIIREKTRELSDKVRKKHSELIMDFDKKIKVFYF